MFDKTLGLLFKNCLSSLHCVRFINNIRLYVTKYMYNLNIHSIVLQYIVRNVPEEGLFCVGIINYP